MAIFTDHCHRQQLHHHMTIAGLLSAHQILYTLMRSFLLKKSKSFNRLTPVTQKKKKKTQMKVHKFTPSLSSIIMYPLSNSDGTHNYKMVMKAIKSKLFYSNCC